MSVTYAQNNSGGGLFSQLFPKLMGMAGTAIGGPIGGKIGQMGGNLISGNTGGAASSALGIIGNLGTGTPQSAGNPMPDDDEMNFNPNFSFLDNNSYFKGGRQWPSM